ncbi:MAG TPA: hypothetical protein IAB06_01775 [Candidatus Avacidaminococcus intestinavium]|uniref:Uncharacterized protein n=1 Tax=Candidatus Avacidaminococcus intestinavium TaxID=2840684 RepID=A0A9D1SLA2_9FIRM|nr:hypothetical protein [Candidatus Avacidaminococcus intestinavium]
MPSNIKSVCEHIKNVRKSLKSAEDSFRSNNDMRGELDLMLAEAEMQHLREKRGFGFKWTRQKLAFAFAVLLTLTGTGGWLWAKQAFVQPGMPTQVATETQSARGKPIVQEKAVNQAEQAPKNSELPLPTKLEQPQPIGGEIVYKEKNKIEPSLPVPDAEIRNLVRAARKTLSESN